MRYGKTNTRFSLTSGAVRGAGRVVLTWAAGAALLAGPAQAVSVQGTLGATSTGSITITATVPNRAQITNLSDITFTNADPGSAASMAENNCVWSNTATKGYSITATGSGTSGAFTLGATGGLLVPYSVQWAQTTGQTTGNALTSGTALTGQVSTATKPTCSGGSPTASLVVGIAAADLQGMVAAASYSGVLTLVVTPQ